MTNERSLEIYSRLADILKREGLDWIIESVEEQIRAGEVKETEVKVPSKILPRKLEEYRQETTRGQEFLFSEHKPNNRKRFYKSIRLKCSIANSTSLYASGST